MGCSRSRSPGCPVPRRLWERLGTWGLGSGAVALLLTGGGPAGASAQAPSAAASLVFDGVTVVDVERGKLVPGRRVVIAGNRIKAVGAAGAVKLPKGAHVVKAEGKYLIPGLWDMHHHPMRDLSYLLLLANGVTGFRDAWSHVPLETLRLWRQEILAGTRVGPPRQLLAGGAINVKESCSPESRWDRKEHHGWAGHYCVESGDSAGTRRLLEGLKAAGAEMLKIYEPSWGIYATARRLGLPFGGHGAPELQPLERSDSGAAIVDHSGAAGKSCRWIDSSFSPSVETCRQTAERFRRNGTWWVPTCIGVGGCGGPRAEAVYNRFFELVGKFAAFSVLNPYAPDSTGRNVLHTAMPPASRLALPADSLSIMLMGLPGKVDMPILAGTDVVGQWPPFYGEVAGFAIHAELAAYVAEGLTPLHALQAATLNPAKFLHATDSLGSVARGKLADLVLLDADPLADITNTTTVRAVVANGRYFDRAALDQLLADFQAQTEPWKP